VEAEAKGLPGAPARLCRVLLDRLDRRQAAVVAAAVALMVAVASVVTAVVVPVAARVAAQVPLSTRVWLAKCLAAKSLSP
jgi:hypothetical protein